MENRNTKDAELIKIRRIISDTGALAYAQNQIKHLYAEALHQIASLKMDQKYSLALNNFSQKILKA